MSSQSRVYVGNVPTSFEERDIEHMFSKYGKIETIDLKNRRGPPHFAFIEFADSRDASDAVRGRDGYKVEGFTLHVEISRGTPRGRGGAPGSPGWGDRGPPSYGSGYRSSDGYRAGGRGPPMGGFRAGRGSGNRVYVSGLPPTGSWQDLKDHMRQIGDVTSADVDRNRDGTGWCEFATREDAKTALKKLDDSKFRSHKGESAYIRVHSTEPDGRSGRGGSRSRSRSRSRSPRGRGGGGGGGGRGSPSYSPVGGRRRKSKSRSRSRSRSASASSASSNESRSRNRRQQNAKRKRSRSRSRSRS